MGRRPNPFCIRCMERKTSKNTYFRSSGGFAAYCKSCDKLLSTRRMVIQQARAGGGKRWLVRRINQTLATLDLYRDILSGWSK